MRTAIEEHHAKFVHSDYRVDTSKFRLEFYNRFNYLEVRDKGVSIIHKSLFSEYPWMYWAFAKKLINKIIKLGR